MAANTSPVILRLSVEGAQKVRRALQETSDDTAKLGRHARRIGDDGTAGFGALRQATERSRGSVSGLVTGLGGAVATVGRLGALAAVGFGAVGAAAGVAATKVIGLASDAAETASSFNTVFAGDPLGGVTDQVEQLHREFGIARTDLREGSRTFGIFGKAAGVAEGELGAFATSLTTAGLDLSSFYNTDPGTVFQDLRSGLAGEAEPLRKYGIFLSEAMLQAEAAQMGFTGTLTESQKVMVRQRLILESLGDAQGDLARTADAPANQFRRISGLGEELATTLGQVLLPAVGVLAPALGDTLADASQRLTDTLPDLQERVRGVAGELLDGGRHAADWARGVWDAGQVLRDVWDADPATLARKLREFGDSLGLPSGAVEVLGDLGVLFRDTLVPAVRRAAEYAPGLDDLGEAVGVLADNAGRLVGPVTAVGAALLTFQTVSGVASVVSGVAGSVGALGGVLLSPVGLLALLAGGLALAYTQVDPFREAVDGAVASVRAMLTDGSDLREWLDGVGAAFVAGAGGVEGFVEQVTGVAGQVRDLLDDVGATFAESFGDYDWRELATDATDAAETVGAVVASVVETVGYGVGALSSLWSVFGDGIVGGLVNAFDLVVGVASGALEAVRGVFDVGLGLLSGDWRRVWLGLAEIGAGALNAIISGVGFMAEAALSVTQTLLEQSARAAEAMGLDGLATRLDDAAAGVDGFRDRVNTTLDGVRDQVTMQVDTMQAERHVADLVASVSEAGDALSRMGGRDPFGPRDATGIGGRPRLEARALGGPTEAGVAYLIGENGPELWTAPADGTIVPHSAITDSARPLAASIGLTAAEVARLETLLPESLTRTGAAMTATVTDDMGRMTAAAVSGAAAAGDEVTATLTAAGATWQATAHTAAAGTVGAVVAELQRGAGDVARVVGGYASTLAGGLNPILTSVGKPAITVSGHGAGGAQEFAVGGVVPGSGVGDTVPAWLTPREYVLTTSMADEAGLDRLEAWRSGRTDFAGLAQEYAVGGVVPGSAPDRDSPLPRHADGLAEADADRRARRDALFSGRTIDGADHDGPGARFVGFGGVKPWVAAAGNFIRERFGVRDIGGVAARANASDHPSGHALDFMTYRDKGLGDRIAGLLQAQSRHFAVKYLIWQQAINRGSGWSRMADRGSITANHYDHVHASFLRQAGGGAAFAGGGEGWGGGGEGGWAVMNPLPVPPRIDLAGPVGMAAAATMQHTYDAAKDWAASAFGPVAGMGDLGAFAGGGDTAANRTLGQQMSAARGWAAHWPSLDALVRKESGWRNTAQNPTSTAFGQFQFLNSTWGPYGAKTSDPARQIDYGLRYIADRYGDPSAALRFHLSHNWYSQGGEVEPVPVYDNGGVWPAGTLGVNASPEPEAVFTQPQLTALLERSAQPAAGTDSSVHFNAPVTVVTPDPDDFIRQLKAMAARR